MVSCSSAKAKYRTVGNIGDEMVWLQYLYQDLGIITQTPMAMHYDNQVAVFFVGNLTSHKRTKHMEIDSHFIRDKVLRVPLKHCMHPPLFFLSISYPRV